MMITELQQSDKNLEEDRSFYESQDVIEDDDDQDIDLRVYEQQRDSMRNELSGYLDSLHELNGSDGKSLLSIPSNVDSVSAAMNRGDLTSNVQNPWSKYLLDSQFEDDMNVEFQGRYYGLSNTDSLGDQKIMRGLAEIHLLDNQLSALTKKQIRIRNGALSEAGDDEASRAMSARSTMSKADGTFLTRIKQSMHGSHDDSNQLNTSKEDDEDEDDFDDDDMVEGLTEGSPTIKSKESKTRMKVSVEDKDNGGGGAISARTGGSASKAPHKRPLSAQLIRVSGLSQRDDIKLRMLLDEDDDDVEPFGGLHEEDIKRLADIDRELEEYKSSDPLFSSRAKLIPPVSLPAVHPGITVIVAEDKDKDEDKDLIGRSPSPTRQPSKLKAPKGDPIIAEQRALREHKHYVDDLDRKLARVRSMDIDYSGLLVDEATTATGEEAIAGPSDDRSAGILERRISMRDIRNVLDTLLGSLQDHGDDEEGGLDSDYDEMRDKVPQSNGDNTQNGSPTTTENNNNNHSSPSSSRVPLSSHRSSNNNTPSPTHKLPLSPSQDDGVTSSSSHHYSRPATGTTAYSSTVYTDSTSPTDSVKKSMRRRKDRAGIDRLLSDHRSEIVRLGFLRHNKRLKSMVAQTNSSGGSLALNTARSEITTASATAAALAAMGNFDEVDEQYDYEEQEGAWTGSPNGKRTYKRSPETARSSVQGSGNKHQQPPPVADPVDEVAAFLQARIREKHQDHGGVRPQQQPVIMFGRSASVNNGVGVTSSRNNNNNQSEPVDKDKIKQALKRLKKFPRGSSAGDNDVMLPDAPLEEKGYTVFPPITQQRRPQSGSKSFRGSSSSSGGGSSDYGYEEMGDDGDAVDRDPRQQRYAEKDDDEPDDDEDEEEETSWQLREMLKQRRQHQGSEQPPAKSTLTL